MKKKLIALALIIIVAFVAMEGLYLLLRRAHNARQSEPTVTSAPTTIAEVEAENPTNVLFRVDNRKVPQRPEPREPGERMQQYEDIPADKLAEIVERREQTMGALYAKRFNMTEEEWNALTPKEQRHLIRKGTK